MEAEVDGALRGAHHEVLSEGFGLSITRKDLQTLSNLNWLNDEVSTHYHQGQICVWIISRHLFCTRWTHCPFVFAYVLIYIIIKKRLWLYCAYNNCCACSVSWNSFFLHLSGDQLLHEPAGGAQQGPQHAISQHVQHFFLSQAAQQRLLCCSPLDQKDGHLF